MQSISPDAVTRAYDRYAPFYDMLFGRILEPGRRALAESIARLPGQPARLLEIGVGTGLTLLSYPEQSAVTGIDLSSDMLEVARGRAARAPARSIELIQHDGESLPFPDASFDCVTLPYVLSVTPSPARLIHEARRVCTADGRLFVLNHFSGGRFWRALEHVAAPFAARIGFRSSFTFEDHILCHDWTVESVRTVNLFGLSRLVELRNR